MTIERFTVQGANPLTELVAATEPRVWYSRLIPDLVKRGVLVRRGKAWFGRRAEIIAALAPRPIRAQPTPKRRRRVRAENETPAPAATGRGLELVSGEREQGNSNTDERRREWLDYRGVADLLRLPVGTVRSMVARKQIPFTRLAARVVRFNRTSIEAWLASRSVEVGGR